ncbi:YlxR family protein [Phototrophicus methaneseepsis]|uniref:YlxR family protein n=1 Tax=Phototrophicus methaneseepsis TaxID=2710758 RepID=A0A7S8ICI1_9CHLR|nr:YlxR family protein [Phototrophicus methaneseepsis]
MPHRMHVALRTCVVCGKKADKRTLMRVVLTEDGLSVDPSGKMNGRGAYVCPNVSCQETSDMNEVFRKLSRALRIELTDADRQQIRQLASS